MADYSSTSPYYTTTQTSYLDVINFRDIPAQVNDLPWTVTPPYMHRPDLLAWDLYQDVTLWWVFAVRNKDLIEDPVYDLVPGLTIYIPQLSVIRESLGV